MDWVLIGIGIGLGVTIGNIILWIVLIKVLG